MAGLAHRGGGSGIRPLVASKASLLLLRWNSAKSLRMLAITSTGDRRCCCCLSLDSEDIGSKDSAPIGVVVSKSMAQDLHFVTIYFKHCYASLVLGSLVLSGVTECDHRVKLS